MQHFYSVTENSQAIIDFDELATVTSQEFADQMVYATDGSDMFNMKVDHDEDYLTLHFIAVPHIYNGSWKEAVSHHNCAVHTCVFGDREEKDFINFQSFELSRLLFVGLKVDNIMEGVR